VVQISALSMKFQPDPTKVFQASQACFSSPDHPNGMVSRQSSDARPFGRPLISKASPFRKGFLAEYRALLPSFLASGYDSSTILIDSSIIPKKNLQ